MADNNKIMFKRGLQNALPSTGVNGVFYLTTDTNRLYIGKGTGAPALLNQAVKFVNSVDHLPTQNIEEDVFYYCTSDNVLAIYINGEWQQINPDTTTDTAFILLEGAVSECEIDNVDKALDYKFSLQQKKVNMIEGTVLNDKVDPVEFNFSIKSSDLAQILPTSAKVSIKADEQANDEIVIKTEGAGSDNTKSITLSAINSDTVSLSCDENDIITIDAIDTKYDLSVTTNSSNKNVIRLTDSETSATEDVVVDAGTGLSITANTNGITYSHSNVQREDDAVSDTTILSESNSLNIVAGIESNAQGHITKVIKTPIKLPEDENVITSIEQPGDWQATLKKKGTGVDSLKIDFTEEATQLKNKLEDYISTKLAENNTALTYKGTIDAYSDLTGLTNVEIGDVYLLSEDNVYNEKLYKTGDMFIATCASDEDHFGGVIINEKVIWTYVPSGDELNTDTLFYGTITAGTNSITYGLAATRSDNETGVNPTVPTNNKNLTLIASDGLTLTPIATTGTATIKHSVYNTTAPEAGDATSTDSFTAITGLVVNNGHVTTVTKEKFTPATYGLETDSNNLKFVKIKSGTGVNESISQIALSGDSWVSFVADNNGLKVSHSNPSAVASDIKATNNTTALSAGNTFNIIDNIQYDSKGHIVKATTQTLTLPADENTTYDMFLGTANTATQELTVATVNPWLVLRNSAGLNNSIQFISNIETSPIVIKSNAAGTNIEFSLEWGTFDTNS